MEDRPIAWSTKAAFGVGQLAEGLKNYSFAALLLFYYNQVFEVPASLCGLALGIALVFDAATDPLAGSISDNWRGRFGRRQEGIFFGAISFSGKAASGLGSMLAGVGLSLIAWPTGAEIVSAADVPPRTLVGLALLYGPIVSGFAVVSVWRYTHYGLDRARHADILVELGKRKREGPLAAAADG